MNCKKCVHCEVCKIRGFRLKSKCKYFLNKSGFVKLEKLEKCNKAEINEENKPTEKQITMGEKIKELREEKNWTRETLSEEIFATKTSVRNWEKGCNEPSIFNCILLADVFGVTLDELCCREAK